MTARYFKAAVIIVMLVNACGSESSDGARKAGEASKTAETSKAKESSLGEAEGGRVKGGNADVTLTPQQKKTLSGVEVVKAGRVQGGNAEVTAANNSANISIASVQQEIRSRYQKDIVSCWKDVVATDPHARVKLVLAVDVAPGGRVASAKAKSRVTSLNVCLENKAKTWSFKQLADTTTTVSFSLPLRLGMD